MVTCVASGKVVNVFSLEPCTVSTPKAVGPTRQAKLSTLVKKLGAMMSLS